MLAGSAMALACDLNIWESAYLGSVLAAIQVSRLGNVPIKIKDIKKIIL